MVQVFKALGPAFAPGGALPTTPPEPPSLDQLVAAFDPYSAQMAIIMLASVLFSSVAMSLCTALFATNRPKGGAWATALRRLPWVMVTNLLIGFIVAVALTMCCLPAIPASGATSVAVAAVVLGNQSPFGAVASSIRRVLPQLWMVVGVEMLLWSLVLGSGMVVGALQTPLELAFGDAGVIVGAVASSYLGSVLGTARMALGVVLFEKLEPAPKK